MPDHSSPARGSNYARGLFLTALGGLMLSIDIPLLKLGQGEAWSTMMLRSGMTVAAILLVRVIWSSLSKDAPLLVPGRIGLAVTCLYGASSVLFMLAVFNTSTANLVFILALNTMFAALLSWLFLGERLRLSTLATMIVMLLGIAIIVSDGVGHGRLMGDLMGLGSTLLIASAITLTRASGQPMGMATVAGAVVPFAVALIVVLQHGFAVEAPGWIILNGAIITPLAFFCLGSGPRYLSGAEVAMFYLLETILAPVWVWLIFAEAPSRNVAIGGSILVTALVAHSAWQLRLARQRSRSA